MALGAVEHVWRSEASLLELVLHLRLAVGSWDEMGLAEAWAAGSLNTEPPPDN